MPPHQKAELRKSAVAILASIIGWEDSHRPSWRAVLRKCIRMDCHDGEEVILNEPNNQLNTFCESQSYPPYALPFGDTEIVVISDGPLDLGTPEDSFRGVSKEEIDGQLLRNFLPTDRVVIEQNIPLLTLGGKRILFETGIGSLKMFGPHSGRLQTSLQEAGIDPESIDAVVCSHPHPDHIGGICTDDGVPLFPNAQIYHGENDFNFWTDERLLGKRGNLAAQIARKNLLPVRERIVFFNDEQEFLPGVEAMFTPGHTKEHACFLVTSGNQSMCPDWRSLASSCSAA
jgi:glyoxylase-like metal-dependent hydrolase (beta-lactamase superfamily II)